MQSRLRIREEMLIQLKAAIEAASEADALKIIFRQDITPLCKVPFDHVSVDGESEGTLAIAIFKNSFNEDTLAAPATATGTVDNFEIYGKDPTPAGDELVLWGTVGSLGSGADIEFTRTEWNDETNVRLTRLRVVLR